MNTQLSSRKAKLHIILIGILYIISGFWEYLIGLTEFENIPSGIHFLLDVYRGYLCTLGLVTILAGIIFFLRVNIFRLIIIALAWWNLFTAPLLDIWFSIYSISIKKFTTVASWQSLWKDLFILTIIMTSVRIYIIRILSAKRAGRIFLKRE